MKTTLLLLFSLICSFYLSAYPSQKTLESVIHQLKKGNHNDFQLLEELYLECQSSDEAITLMNELEKRISLPSLKPLNRIAAASRISFWGDHSKALHQLKSVSQQLHAQTTYTKGVYYQALGKISYRSENPRTAIEYYEKSIFYLNKTPESEALQSVYVNLGLAYGAENQHEKALVFYEKAETITDQSSPKVLLYLELNKALSLTSMGKHTDSKRSFLHALTYIEATNDYFAEVRTYGNLADIYLLEDSLAIAENYLLKGRTLAIQQGFKLDLIRFDLTLAELYQRDGKFEQAFLYLQSHDSIRNEVHIEKAAEQVAHLERINQAAVDQLKQKTLQETIRLKKQKNWILWGAVIILSVLLLILLQQFQVIRRKNKVLLKQSRPQISSSTTASQEPLAEETIALIRSFERLLIEQRAFSNATLTQNKVAKKLNTNRTYLSKAINDYYKMSYTRWLNELRISESKKMLVDQKYAHFSIEGIATSVGFSSLSAFNSNFKSITGLTPSYFRKNQIKH